MTKTNSWQELYPFAPRYLSLDGHRLHYVDQGQGGPLLMVHGNPTWSFYWRDLIRAFQTSHRVVAVDHMGCGLSEKPASYNYTLQQHIDNLSGLVNSLDLQGATLIAHDWGGAIGLGCLLANRDRFRSIVLLNTGAFPPPFIPWRIRACRIPVLGTWAVRGLNLFARAALFMAVSDRQSLSPAARAGLLAPYDTWAHRIAIDRFVKDIPASPRHVNWKILEGMEQGLCKLQDIPVQLIWGLRDWCFRPSCLERFTQIFPQAGVIRLPDASHYVVEEATSEVIAGIEQFLEQSDT
jgi:haloalkane dehalogenase